MYSNSHNFRDNGRMEYIPKGTKRYRMSFSFQHFHDRTLLRRTLPRPETSPTGHFPDRTLLRPDTSPTGHFPDRTLLRPDTSPTGHFSDRTLLRPDTSPIGHFSDRTLLRPDTSPAGHIPNRTYPQPDISPTGIHELYAVLLSEHCLKQDYGDARQRGMGSTVLR